MLSLNSAPPYHRVGEIAVIAAPGQDQNNLIKAICPKVITLDHGISFGQLPIDSHLALCFYGFDNSTPLDQVEWDLVLGKIMGYIFFFDWKQDSLRWAIEASRFFLSHVQAPTMFAANQPPDQTIAEKIYNPSIELLDNFHFTLYQRDDRSSIQKIVISLLDIVITHAKGIA